VREPRATDKKARTFDSQAGLRDPFEIFIGLRVADRDQGPVRLGER
jgi:hypothetical protein